MIGVAVPNLTGGYSAMVPNHHIAKPMLVGQIQSDGSLRPGQDPGRGSVCARRRNGRGV